MFWTKGRQGTGYDTHTFFFKFLPSWIGLNGIDCYLIRYNEGDFIPSHIDPISEGYEHHRLNIVIKKPKNGGLFFCDGKIRLGRVHLFRPDIQAHEVTKILKGTRYVFSIGWSKPKRNAQ